MRQSATSAKNFHFAVYKLLGMGILFGSICRNLVSGRGFAAAFAPTPLASSRYSTSSFLSSSPNIENEKQTQGREDDSDNQESGQFTPWNHPSLAERPKNAKAFRSRQHVNPLSSKFQQPTVLSDNWPRDVFDDLASRPLFLDIGCSRGGFLLDIATQRPNDYNYLGLEIRPIVVQHAKDRVSKRPHVQGHIDFVGCNANVDLDRLLTILTNARQEEAGESNVSASPGQKCNLQMVCVQFPDPHFKARHAKRRVVTPELVSSLARFMPAGATVFLQSDIQSVLDEMRLQFREQSQYFEDSLESLEEYHETNMLGIPTEREVSVLEKDLPVYRAVFTRTDDVSIE